MKVKKFITFCFDDGTYHKIEIQKVELLQTASKPYLTLELLENGKFKLVVNEESVKLLSNLSHVELNKEER